MSVHTLWVDQETGMVKIAADITKGEAPEAGLRILRFCFRLDDLLTPIVLDRPGNQYETRAATLLSVLSVEGNTVRLSRECGHCGTQNDAEMAPAKALNIAAVIAAMAERASYEPDPDEAAEVTQHFPGASEDEVRSFLARFTLEERPS